MKRVGIVEPTPRLGAEDGAGFGAGGFDADGDGENLALDAVAAFGPAEQSDSLLLEASPSLLGPRSDWWDCYPGLGIEESRVSEGAFDEVDATLHPTYSYGTTEFAPQSSVDACAWRALNPTAPEPVCMRLMLAVSSDGLTWVKTGIVIANHASVPCMAVEDGVLYLFFNAAREFLFFRDGTPPGPSGTTPLCVAYTRDLIEWNYRIIGDHGQGFTYRGVATNQDQAHMEAQDPSVVPAPNGADGANWYLYFTMHWVVNNVTQAATFVASAARLADFQWTQLKDGYQVFPPPGVVDFAEDPSVQWVGALLGGGHYQYTAGLMPLGGLVKGNPRYAWNAQIDTDGVTLLASTFSADGVTPNTVSPTCGGLEVLLSNPLTQSVSWSGPVPWYSFVGDPNGLNESYIIAPTVAVGPNGASITGGVDGTATPCVPTLVRDRDYEANGVKDPAVAKFLGCYVMAYCTEIPDTSPVVRQWDLRDQGFRPPQWERLPGLNGPPPFVVPPWLADPPIPPNPPDWVDIPPLIWHWRGW